MHYQYFRLLQGPWTKSWLGVGIQCIDIHYTVCIVICFIFAFFVLIMFYRAMTLTFCLPSFCSWKHLFKFHTTYTIIPWQVPEGLQNHNTGTLLINIPILLHGSPANTFLDMYIVNIFKWQNDWLKDGRSKVKGKPVNPQIGGLFSLNLSTPCPKGAAIFGVCLTLSGYDRGRLLKTISVCHNLQTVR